MTEGGSDGEHREPGEAIDGGAAAGAGGADPGAQSGAFAFTSTVALTNGSTLTITGAGAGGLVPPDSGPTIYATFDDVQYAAACGVSLLDYLRLKHQPMAALSMQQLQQALSPSLQHYAAQQNALGQMAYPGLPMVVPLGRVAMSGYPFPQTACSPEPPKLEHETVVGELIGWRGWRILPLTGDLLVSLTQMVAWPTTEPLHSKGVADHSPYGAYAFKTEAAALAQLLNERKAGQVLAIGRVRLWGTVVEHDDGWRAEYACVHSLEHIIGGGRWGRARKLRLLRQRYGLDP